MSRFTEQVKRRTNILLLNVFFTALAFIIWPVKARADDYIIVYRGHLQKQNMLKRPPFAVSRSFNIIPAVAARLDAGQVEQLRKNPDVAYIEPDYKIYALGGVDTKADSLSEIVALSSPQTIPYGITMVNAPAVWPRTTGAGVRVAVLDTGISMYHPDRGNVVDSVSFVTGEAVEDFHSHGTHTSGTIAAADNDIGVVGVAPEADLLIAKVIDINGDGLTSGLISGIEWAVNNNAKVISMSLGGYNYSAALETACDNAYAAGLLLVAAAGNDDVNTPSYPAALASVISVAAVDQNKNKASFSNYGPTIALAAPGVSVYSTVPVDSYDSADAVWDGNSHQANVVLGTAPGTASGVVCNCGLATGEEPNDICPDSVAGNIAHIRRGTNTFAEKVAHAQSKGAIGVIISNNIGGNFNGTLGDGTPLVVVSVSKADGNALQTLAESGITGTVSVDAGLYAYKNGTSMACPHVSGVAALIFAAAHYNITPDEVSNILFDSAEDLGEPGIDDIFGYGLVDAYAALNLEKINILAAFASNWLESCSSPDWCEGMDTNQSGRVDFVDFATLTQNW
ncbi:MAG: S8 family serine peptidase [Planctomycetota bacterium]